MQRPDISDAILLQAIEAVTVATGKRIEGKGRGVYLSHAESLGQVSIEFAALLEAVKNNDPQDIGTAAVDIASACIFVLGSMLVSEQKIKEAHAAITGTTPTTH